MRSSLRAVALALGAACGGSLSAPAAADVIFEFQATGLIVSPGPVQQVGGYYAALSLSDEAFAAGVNIQLSAGLTNPCQKRTCDPPDFASLGLTSLMMSPFVVSLSPFTYQPNRYWTISLTSAPGGTPTGLISFIDGNLDNGVRWTLAGEASDMRTADAAVCGGYSCVQPGITTIPEPSGLGALALGLVALGFAAVRRYPRFAGVGPTGSSQSGIAQARRLWSVQLWPG